MNLVPICFCKNEEVWIRRVLTSLANVFEHVIVADTGSTDSTLEQIAKVPKVHLMIIDNPSTVRLGALRGEMQREAAEKFGATHIMLVDGDELYPTRYVRFIHDNPMPPEAEIGHTCGIEVEELPNGEIWLYGIEGKFSRDCILSVNTVWQREHPYESPIVNRELSFRYEMISPFVFYHLHHTRRSSKDDEVYLRMQKRYQFSMRDAPEMKPKFFWLANESEYKDV